MSYEVIATSTTEHGEEIAGATVVVVFSAETEAECQMYITSVSGDNDLVWPFAAWEPGVDGTLTTRVAL